MATAHAPSLREEEPRSYGLWAGVLSYLIPGLGQICQGRVGKGILFLVCLYGLFFYGMYLGNWRNVMLPDTARNDPWLFGRPGTNLYNRLQFVGQFWIGVAAWPAIYQHAFSDPNLERDPYLGTFQRAPSGEEVLNRIQREGDKSWDLGWVFTVVAGVLNILVIYDAVAGPAFAEAERQGRREDQPQPEGGAA